MTALEQAEKWFLNRNLDGSLTSRSDLARSRDVTDRPGHVTRSSTHYGTARGRADRRTCRNCQELALKPNTSGTPAKVRDRLPVINRASCARDDGKPERKTNGFPVLGSGTGLPRHHVSQPLLGGERQHVRCRTRQVSHRVLRPASFSLPIGMDSVGMSSAGTESTKLGKVGSSVNGTNGFANPDGTVLPRVGRRTSAEGSSVPDSADNDPDFSRTPRLSATEREAQKEVEHNWILLDRLRDMNRQFERRRNHLAVTVPDEDAMAIVEKRLEEIRHMAQGKASKKHVLDKYHPAVRDMILKYKDIPVQQIKKMKFKKPIKALDRFRGAANLVMLLLRGFHGRTIYFADQTDSRQLRRKTDLVSAQRGLVSGRASINYDLRLSLTTQPHLRDGKSIKQIMWVLRATKAFKHLFPTEMEEELARNVAYERYDDGRVIAWQGRAPDRFYYIISGRVNLLRQYKLSSGHVTKSMAFLTKGMTTDPQEIDKQWMREENLVTKGQVEVLLLDKKSFRLLEHTTDGPPVDFLQSLHLFQEFPMDRFIHNHDSVEVKYYGSGKIIVKDSNRTPWLHVVKSGLVKVVRRQSVIDTRLSNESKFSAPTIERIGCGKPFSHADAMLGFQAKQKKMKAFREGLILPQIGATTVDMSANPLRATLGLTSPAIYRQHSSDSRTKFSENEENGQVDSEEEEEDTEEREEEEQSNSSDNSKSKQSKRHTSPARSRHQLNEGHSVLDVTDFEPHDLWLTREKTSNEALFPRIKKKEVHHRRAYLQLDVLQPGDVFGLDHMQPAVASEPVGVSLLSDGAEVVKISKRFFLQNADNNTMLKVETMYKEYLSEKEAEQALYHQETWEQYKAALWSRMTASRPPVTTHDR